MLLVNDRSWPNSATLALRLFATAAHNIGLTMEDDNFY